MSDEFAYPRVENTIGGASHAFSKGLTKREYFAAKAMQGILANKALTTEQDNEWIAAHAINQADALIKELES